MNELDQLQTVEEAIKSLDPQGERFAKVLRQTLDQLYDGQRTGRWDFNQLHKTEKTHMGTLIEINLQKEFSFEDGSKTDYKINRIDVDCKYSMTNGGWNLPPEVINNVALLITASDIKSEWQAGLIFVDESVLNKGRNRDSKATLSLIGRQKIVWLWGEKLPLSKNLLLHLPMEVRTKILNSKSKRGTSHAQEKVNELFRSVQETIIRSNDIATVAQTKDYLRCVRMNGGARSALKDEGIIVLGHSKKDREIALSYGAPLPQKGEFVSIKVEDKTQTEYE